MTRTQMIVLTMHFRHARASRPAARDVASAPVDDGMTDGDFLRSLVALLMRFGFDTVTERLEIIAKRLDDEDARDAT